MSGKFNFVIKIKAETGNNVDFFLTIKENTPINS